MDASSQSHLKYFAFVSFIFIACYLWTVDPESEFEINPFQQFLKKSNLEDVSNVIQAEGINSIEEFASIDIDKSALKKKLNLLSLDKVKKLHYNLREKYILEAWLQSVGYDKYISRFEELEIASLNHMLNNNFIEIDEKFHWKVEKLKSDVENYSSLSILKDRLWVKKKSQLMNNSNSYVRALFSSLTIAGLSYIVYRLSHETIMEFFNSIINWITGDKFDINKTEITWGWRDPKQVGSSVTFKIKFFKRNYSAYQLTETDSLTIDIMNSYSAKCTPTVEIHNETDPYVFVSFIVTKYGEYAISVLVNGKHIPKSPCSKTFMPGTMDPSKSEMIHHSNVMVYSISSHIDLTISPKDQYENLCFYDPEYANNDRYMVQISESKDGTPWSPEFVMFYDDVLKYITLEMMICKEGIYDVDISYDKIPLKNAKFTALVLNEADYTIVNKTVKKRQQTYGYEARLLSCNQQALLKPKKVYCYISPKQLVIKEFFLIVIPKRLYTFRVCPSTKLKFLGFHSQYNAPILEIEDGTQPSIVIAMKDRNIFAAIFSSFLLNNIGGSETFADKLRFFYGELREIHRKHSHSSISVFVNRQEILESSMKHMYYYSTSDWCKKFEISFINEPGLDWGGLRREWFELICIELFDPSKSSLFKKFKDDSQGLIHPKTSRFPPNSKQLKFYEFAGKVVGKSIYESSLGNEFRQNVKARFSRSFLAQLIGLRVNYKYFMHDDPELYTSKIKFIEENDVDDMELTFSEEVYENGKLYKVVDLIPNGKTIKVTKKNKIQYLHSLAEYKLAVSVKDEIDAFLKGFNELVPDNLLSIFDENELELLICGTGNYCLADFKKHHVMSSSLFSSRRVGDWFWTIVSNYSQEEMARLLQFTTGCSQLPPGGFADLCPNLQINLISKNGGLPTAHTCFNQLCLPVYESMQEMMAALKLAFEEGSTGFGLA